MKAEGEDMFQHWKLHPPSAASSSLLSHVFHFIYGNSHALKFKSEYVLRSLLHFTRSILKVKADFMRASNKMQKKSVRFTRARFLN